jgi:hypothetical protein
MRIQKFREFVNETYSVNEGLGSWISSFMKKALSTVTGWARGFFIALEKGKVKLIPSGPKAGLPMVMVYPQSVGPVTEQIKKMWGAGRLLDSEQYLKEERYSQRWSELPKEILGNVDDVSPDELISEIKTYIRAKRRRDPKAKAPDPIFIFGAPGIGKTGVVAQVIDEMEMDLINIDIQFMSPEDFLGLPSAHQEYEPVYKEIKDPKDKDKTIRVRTSDGSGFSRNNPPTYLPTDDGEKGNGGIIFLDEFNRPQTDSMMNALLNFVQSGRIGQYKLPHSWVIIAAGNRPGEATVTEPDAALARRFNIVNLVTTVKDFEKYAKKHNPKILDEVIYFLSSGPDGKPQEDLLHYLDPDVDPMAFPAPANWASACEMLHDIMEDEGVTSWQDLPIETVEKCFRRKIGPGAAAKFMTYLKVIKKIGEAGLEEISKDPLKAPLFDVTYKDASGSTKKENSLLYSIADMAFRRIPKYDAERFANLVEYFSRFNQNEILVWVYGKIAKEYPEFKLLDDDGPDAVHKKRAIALAGDAQKRKIS